MPDLVLVRHGLARPKLQGERDWDRPLTPSGRTRVAQVSAQLKQRGLDPQVILHSDAIRTTQTAEILHECFGGTDVVSNSHLYEANWGGFTDIICSRQYGSLQSMILVGHNPLISEIACTLSGQILFMEPGDGVWLSTDADSLSHAIENGDIWTLKSGI